ncbi:hypothetical protein NP233_g9161 [Leucocoprinus birnbaumii]|uniref:Mitochondrial carrier n=1 Tax=Leucocoprinus birnbaumii TaxID=56174 RepID=A0AAD5YT36_9AGAR|nr:hypothetical protein NP233_g9161 [Leucocoprinus birnbaumii]
MSSTSTTAPSATATTAGKGEEEEKTMMTATVVEVQMKEKEEVKEVKKSALGFMFLTPEVASYFIAGGCAGAASRTVVSPLERLKIIQQVQPRGSNASYNGVWNSLARMWREEGFRGFMRGNGINCLRIVPYSAVQFTTYEQLKKFLTRRGTKELDTPKRLAAGAMAGITSVCSTYPLDLVRSRLSIATASVDFAAAAANTSAAPAVAANGGGAVSVAAGAIPSVVAGKAKTTLASGYHTSSSSHAAVAATSAASGAVKALKSKYSPKDLTMWGMTLKVMREEGGVKALYRGLITTAVGVAPYVGINFAAYEALRGYITPPGKTSAWRKLSCGALADRDLYSGSISQTLTYPFDVLRRKMQVTGMQGGPKYNGALDALRSTLRGEGVKGLYRGLWPNLLKVAPSIATSFFTYELVKEMLVG